MTLPRLLIALACLALLGSAAVADVINVPGDQPTIAAAISASVNGDVIAIAAGTYNEHSLDPGGKAITIGSASGNPDVTIDANGGGSVFVFQTGETSETVIKDLVITGGSADDGGGIYCVSSNPTISGCTISDNMADYGGGIRCWDSSPTITNCTIEGNMALTGGGIACQYSNSTISGCVISSNTANYGSGIYHAFSNSILSDTIVCGNVSDQIYGSWTDDGGNIVENECPACPGDATGDYVVDVNDVLYLISAWDTPDPNADFDEDGLVDADDVLILLSNFGEACP